MRLLTSFLLGVLALGVPVYAAIVCVGLGVAAADADLRVAAGPILFVAVESTRAATETTIGPGPFVVALLGGAANAVAAAVLARRRRTTMA